MVMLLQNLKERNNKRYVKGYIWERCVLAIAYGCMYVCIVGYLIYDVMLIISDFHL